MSIYGKLYVRDIPEIQTVLKIFNNVINCPVFCPKDGVDSSGRTYEVTVYTGVLEFHRHGTHYDPHPTPTLVEL